MGGKFEPAVGPDFAPVSEPTSTTLATSVATGTLLLVSDPSWVEVGDMAAGRFKF
jgi:hypothetical protein